MSQFTQNDAVLKTSALLLIDFGHRISRTFYEIAIYRNIYYSKKTATVKMNENYSDEPLPAI